MKTPKKISRELLAIYQAAAASNDGQRCMIAPSPEIREKLKKELERLKDLSAFGMLSNILTPKQQTRVGLNDSLIYPGNVFPMGTSAMAARAKSVERSPLRGVVRIIVVLVEFTDKKIKFNKKHYEDLFFADKPGGKSSSVLDYYSEVTNGLVQIQGEVVGPLKLPHTMSYYAHGESGMSNKLPNARTMAEDAAKLANAKVDFSKYDNDHNGYVDAFVVVHAGRGAEETASKSDIWSHKWVLPNAFDADGTQLYSYLTVPEDCKLGVCAHELGHLLFGFPDLYDTDYSSEGVGSWCLMGGGSWNGSGDVPAHPSAWCKAQQGWVSVIKPGSNLKNVSIEDVKTGNKVYRMWQNGSPGNEYFLMENRQQQNFDQFLPGNGLLIWHIDDAIDDNSNELHYKVSLVQADGLKDLEAGNNAGDGADSWPGSGGKHEFSKTSSPASLSYGGLDTSVQVKAIKSVNGVIKADLYVTKGPLKDMGLTVGKKGLKIDKQLKAEADSGNSGNKH